MIEIKLDRESAAIIRDLLDQMPLSGRAVELARILTVLLDVRDQIDRQIRTDE
jgi:hypothetical protein